MNVRSIALRFAGLGAAMVLAAGIGLGPTAFASSYSIVGSQLPNPTFTCAGNAQTGYDYSGTGGTFSGTVVITGNYTGAITLELWENPQQNPIPSGSLSYTEITIDYATTPSAFSYDPSTDQTTVTYSFTDVGTNGGNGSYIAGVIGSNPPVSGSAKTNSVHCAGTPTAAAYSNIRIHSAGGKHVLTWYATRPVLGYNVYAGHTKLNHALVTSTSSHYRFATTHSIAHLTLKPVNR